MVSALLRLAGAALFFQASAVCATSVDLARWSDSLPTHFSVHGDKTEPTYQASVDVRRDGDVFTLVGGAPIWAERSEQKIAVSRDGRLHYLVCPKGMDCSAEPPPSGFLATASIVSAARRGQLHGSAVTAPFGAREIICIAAENIGVRRPFLDPCFDVETGAVLAQRHRLTGAFEGPSLDPTSIRVSTEN